MKPNTEGQVITIVPVDSTGPVVGPGVEVRPLLRGPIDYRECITALVPLEVSEGRETG